MTFDMTQVFRADLPSAAAPWAEPPDHAFVGGNNDADSVPYDVLAEAAVTVLQREGPALATYNLGGSPLGYLPMRNFIVDAMALRAGTAVAPDEILITSGSLQALDLVNQALLAPGDTVIIEEATYGGMISRPQRAEVNVVGVRLDGDGIDTDHLEAKLERLSADSMTPKYIYTIPTVQNPTGSVLPSERRRKMLELSERFGVPIFEDDCYADLVWTGDRPPTIRALDDDGGGHVVYCGSFSKSIAPALRVGYLIADAPVIRQLLALKTDAGTGALEQLTLAEFAPTHFDDHVERLITALQIKCDAMMAAVQREFGDEVQLTTPKGGIYVWLTFPEGVDTDAFAAAASEAGVLFNPGSGWSADASWGSRRLRLCFGDADIDSINASVSTLARVYREQCS